MERKQTPSEPVTEKLWRERIEVSKQSFRVGQRNLSFNDKLQIAFGMSKRDEQVKKAKKK